MADALALPLPDSRLRVTPAPAKLSILRLRTPTSDRIAHLSSAFGHEWPTRPNTRVRCVYWLSPHEWAIVGVSDAEVKAKCAVALGGALHHVADVGAGHTHWRIEGPASRELLARSTSLDLHYLVFVDDCCAQTLFAQIYALLARADEGCDAFDLFVDASYDSYLTDWFGRTAAECDDRFA